MTQKINLALTAASELLDELARHFGEPESDTRQDIRKVQAVIEAAQVEADATPAAVEFVRKLVETFPEFDADEDLNGGDAVERLGALWDRAKAIANPNPGPGPHPNLGGV